MKCDLALSLWEPSCFLIKVKVVQPDIANNCLLMRAPEIQTDPAGKATYCWLDFICLSCRVSHYIMPINNWKTKPALQLFNLLQG